jgi:hypothetical protein
VNEDQRANEGWQVNEDWQANEGYQNGYSKNINNIMRHSKPGTNE